MLVLQHDKSVFLKLNTAVKGSIYAIKVGAFFNGFARRGFTVPFFCWIGVFKNDIAPAVEDGTIKSRNALVIHKECFVTSKRRKHNNIWCRNITWLVGNISGVADGVARILSGVDVIASFCS